MDYKNTEYQYNIVDVRKLLKSGCKEMDWKNVKKISPYEIAYCIYTHGLSFDDVPEKRKRSVQKEIDKLVMEKDKKDNKKTIESILAVYESDDAIYEFLESGTKIDELKPDSLDTVVDYIFDPELFSNAKSAKEALIMVEDLTAGIINSIMENGARYKDGKYDKHIKSAKKATIRLFETYEKLGIPRSITANALNSIDRELNTTVKQELDSYREDIIENFISLGNSKTNATKIANAITLLSEKNIPMTSKF